jgi:RsiW-degrading membrane proteinase PrsW (M82 family)
VNAILALLAGLPSVLVVRHVRARLEPDPAARSLWSTFVLGALSTGIVLALAPLLTPPIVPSSAPYLAGLLQAIVSAALPEESVKLLVVGFAVARGRVHDRRSGLAHGLAASLGFAAVEMVLFASLKGIGTTALRTFTTLPCHAFLGCVMGSVLGGAGRTPGARRLCAALLLPVALHGAYDFPLMVLARESTPARPGTWSFATLTALGSAMVVLGAIAASCLYRDVFPRVASVAARSTPLPEARSAQRAGWVARTLIPLGMLLASAGSWIVGSLFFVGLPSADLSPTAGRATTALWAVGAALLCFGLAFGMRGLRARRAHASALPVARD